MGDAAARIYGVVEESVKAYSETAALGRAAEDRGPGRTTGVTRCRAGFRLHVWPGWVVLIGEVVVVAGARVPIADDMTPGGQRLPRAPAGRVLTAARRVGVCGTRGQSQTGQP